MAINKVIYQGQTLVDLTNDTITPNDLAEGVTAHAANGELITGTMTGSGGGIDTSDATATASEIFLDKTAYIDGEKVTGEFAIDSELAEQDEIISQIENALNDKIDAYDNGYADGVQAEYNRFWTRYQISGNRTNCDYAFSGYAWNETIFKPKYNIKPTSSATGLFMNSDIAVDLVEYLANLGVTLDLSNATGLTFCFQNTLFTHIGLVDTTNVSSCSNLFANSGNLVTIDTLKCKYTNTWSAAFANCKELQNITIEGEIGKAVSFSACTKLTHDSLMSIINHLRTITTTLTLTLGTTNLAKLTDAEKAIATEKGWTLA